MGRHRLNLYEIITIIPHDPELIQALDEFVKLNLPEFKQVLNDHPIQIPWGGAFSTTEAFWTYFLVKSLQPDVVIESGSYEGYSLYYLLKAAPQAEAYSFDPYNAPKKVGDFQYRAYDWTEYDFGRPLTDAFVFFDDHIHQGKRLKQAKERGVRHVLFHDNFLKPKSVHGHTSLRFCGTGELAKFQYIFPRLNCDPVFDSTKERPQYYSWLTYVELLEE